MEWAIDNNHTNYVVKLLKINSLRNYTDGLVFSGLQNAYTQRNYVIIEHLMRISAVVNRVLSWGTNSNRYFQKAERYSDICIHLGSLNPNILIFILLRDTCISSYLPLITTLLSIESFQLDYEYMLFILKNNSEALRNFKTYFAIELFQNETFFNSQQSKISLNVWNDLIMSLIVDYESLECDLPDSFINVMPRELIYLTNEF